MATERFVLRYRGEGTWPDDDLARVRALTDTVEVASPRMLVVESEPEPLRQLVEALPDWVMGPDQTYPVPDTRKTIEGPPR